MTFPEMNQPLRASTVTKHHPSVTSKPPENQGMLEHLKGTLRLECGSNKTEGVPGIEAYARADVEGE